MRRSSTARCVSVQLQQHRGMSACAADLLTLHRWHAMFASPTGAMHVHTMACFVAPLHISLYLFAACLQCHMLCCAIKHLAVSVCCMSATLQALQSCTSAADWHCTCSDPCGCCWLHHRSSILRSITSADTGSHVLLSPDVSL